MSNRHQIIEQKIMHGVWEQLAARNRPFEKWSVMRFQLAGDLVLIPSGTPYMAGKFAHTICRLQVNADGSGKIKWFMPESSLKENIDG